ncbi:MAG TPA: murein biosynthesis integral membrane protein MurJ [Geminicoccaceae bacterium]|nr:murein biosynthesis integral membrane protein MurJ [Geminicoccaceae bacterium]
MAAEPGAAPVDQAAHRARPVALIRSFATVSSYTMLSRVMGFVRDVMIAAILGAGPLADAFFVAFKLPNFLRRLFAEGAFNAGFVPLFAGTLEAEGKTAARAFAEQAQAVLLAILVPLVVVAIAAMPWLIVVMAPGFEDGGERYQAAVELSRITFVYILFISLVALQSGVLNSLGRFAAAAAAPVVLNICLIGALLVSLATLAEPAVALAWGVAAAGLMQYLWLRIAVQRADMALGLRRPRWTPEIRRLFGLVLPGVLGAGVAQINLLADVFFASLLPAGAVSYLYYADRLNQLPLGVIGIAVGTALLPLLARQIRAGEVESALASQNRALELALLLTLPCAVGLAVLSLPIMQVLFQRGAFGAADAAATAQVLAAYAFGLPAYVLVKVLVPGFFARRDTRTPVKIAVVCLIANLVFILALLWPLAQVGIALATALAAWLNAGLLGFRLHRQGFLQPDARLRRRLPKIVLASLLMGAALWLLRPWLAPLPQSLALAMLVLLGVVVFAALAQFSGAMALRELKASLARR